MKAVDKTFSILKERKLNEHRVVIIPENIPLFIRAGYSVKVEKDAGIRIGFTDEDYRKAGAIVVSRQEAWESDIIVKYKAPEKSEYKYLKKGQHLFAIFHAEGDPEMVDKLCLSGISAYSFEYFKTSRGYFPLAFPGGEIAGKMAVLYGAYYLQKHKGGTGVLLAEIQGVSKPKVVVIGYGNVGGAAIKVALALGAHVTVLGTNIEKLRKFATTISGDIQYHLYNDEILRRETANADLVIGAILISTVNTSPILTEDIVKNMKKGAVVIDVTCGYGCGYMPTFDRFTNFNRPFYKKYGVLHCKINNLPSAVPLTSSIAFSNQLSPYFLECLDMIVDRKDINKYDWGRIIEKGKVVNAVVKENLSMLENF